MARNILVLATGGTLGMRSKDGALVPDQVLKDLLIWIPELKDLADIHIEIIADIDSSEMNPDIWLQIARRVKEAENEAVDGVVILHGTDTLAYTASVLSFLIPDLGMPVVLTGAQRPLTSTRTDARNNILGAVETSLHGPVEVMVFFHNAAFRGNRVTKIAISDFDAFHSPNLPPLGKAGIDWDWNSSLFWPKTRRPSFWNDLPETLPPAPLVIPWVPGMHFEYLQPALSNHWAVILEAFGTGNIPYAPEVADCFRNYLDQGGLLYVKSQVMFGRVALGAYRPGKVLYDMGLRGGKDMTREAMVTKLMVLKGFGWDNARIRKKMSESLAGELSEGVSSSGDSQEDLG